MESGRRKKILSWGGESRAYVYFLIWKILIYEFLIFLFISGIPKNQLWNKRFDLFFNFGTPPWTFNLLFTQSKHPINFLYVRKLFPSFLISFKYQLHVSFQHQFEGCVLGPMWLLHLWNYSSCFYLHKSCTTLDFQYFIIGWGRTQEAPPLSENLCLLNSCWGWGLRRPHLSWQSIWSLLEQGDIFFSGVVTDKLSKL